MHPGETARQAVAVMAEYDVSQIAVIQAEPPLAAAEVVGAVHERDLMQRALQRPGDPRPAGAQRSWARRFPRSAAARRWTSPCGAWRSHRR